MVGNDEQYAAVMALMANKVGVPARVVLGAVVPEGGEVTGADVSAWVELRVDDGSWRVLPTEAFMDTDRPGRPADPDRGAAAAGLVIPPPAQVPPPSTIDEQTDAEITARKAQRATDEADAERAPAWVRAVLVYAGGAAAGGPARRRRRSSAPSGCAGSRRRSARLVSGRIAGAWRELVDHARDLGQPVPVARRSPGASSRCCIGSAAATGLARRADARVFGPAEPAASEAESYWRAVDAERRTLSAGASRRSAAARRAEPAAPSGAAERPASPD